MEVGVEAAEGGHQVGRVAPARAQPAVAGELEDAQEAAAPDRGVDLQRVPDGVEHADARRPGCRGASRGSGIVEAQRAEQDRPWSSPVGESNSTITPTASRTRYSSQSGIQPSCMVEPEHVDARLRREQRGEVAEQHRRVAHRVVGEQDVADRARRQPLAQRVGVGAPVDADDAADADPEDPVGDVHAGTERRADDEHERPVAIGVAGRAGQLVDAERRDGHSATGPSAARRSA